MRYGCIYPKKPNENAPKTCNHLQKSPIQMLPTKFYTKYRFESFFIEQIDTKWQFHTFHDNEISKLTLIMQEKK